MMNETIHRAGSINDQDCPIHSSPDNFAGKLKTFLAGGSEKVDMNIIGLNPAIIKCHGRSTPGTASFHMTGSRIKSLYQRGFSCTERTENHNLAFFVVRHYH